MSHEWLVDKSALVKMHESSDSDLWADRIERGLVRISTVTLLEVGYSARSAKDWTSLIKGRPISAMPREYVTPKIEQRALEVQGLLARKGTHRAPSIPDLIIAATAEIAQLYVLHFDKDFELIVDTTGQPAERLSPP